MMKKRLKLMSVLLFLFGAVTFYACDDADKTNDGPKGFVTFGANFHVIDCITEVTVYIDNEKVGTLSDYTDKLTECGKASNLTKELTVGVHSYKVEVRPQKGTGCMQKITGVLKIKEGECEKVFVDYYKIFKDNETCEQDVIVSRDEYEKTEHFDKFKGIKIIGDCLHLTISDGGCDGSTWVAKLVDSEVIAESNPYQRYLKLSFENQELCKAFRNREFTFDISELQIAGDDKISLHIGDKMILYEY